jgi:hypothetical protein
MNGVRIPDLVLSDKCRRFWRWLVLCVAAGVFMQLDPALRAVAAVFFRFWFFAFCCCLLLSFSLFMFFWCAGFIFFFERQNVLYI